MEFTHLCGHSLLGLMKRDELDNPFEAEDINLGTAHPALCSMFLRHLGRLH